MDAQTLVFRRGGIHPPSTGQRLAQPLSWARGLCTPQAQDNNPDEGLDSFGKLVLCKGGVRPPSTGQRLGQPLSWAGGLCTLLAQDKDLMRCPYSTI